MTEVRVLPGSEQLAQAVARAFVDLVADPLAGPLAGSPSRPSFAVALTGGTIADLVHREIAGLGASLPVDWPWGATFWWGDERFVPADSPDRNAGQARAAFLDALGVNESNIFEVPARGANAAVGEVTEVRRAAEVYDDLLRLELPGDSFDLVMLGLGPDGHVASLFPGAPQLGVTGVRTVAVTDSPKPPPERVSLTFEALNRTQRVWFLASGQEKAAAVAAALSETGTVSRTPARGVVAPETVWWLDEAAASALG